MRIGLLCLCFATPLAAQRIADYELVRNQVETVRALPKTPFDSSSVRRKTYWLEGGIVGGVITGALGVMLSGLCEGDSSSCPGKARSFLIGAVPGFTIGAFVGDGIKKESDEEAEP